MTDKYDDEWKMWSKHVLIELERLNGCLIQKEKKIYRLSQDMAGIKARSGIYGLIGGAVPVCIVLGYMLLQS